jgi:hypothetical protein
MVGTFGQTSPDAVSEGVALEIAVFHVVEKLLKTYSNPLVRGPKPVTSIVSSSGE